MVALKTRINSSRAGQISIFLIISVVLVLGVVLFFVFTSGSSLFTAKQSEESTVRKNMLGCLGSSFDATLKLSAQRGGPITNMENKFITATDSIEIYYDRPALQIPSLAEIESDLGPSIAKTLNSCFAPTSVLTQMGYSVNLVSFGDGTFSFEADKTVYNLNATIDVTVSNKTYSFSDLKLESTIPYRQLYLAAVQLATNCYIDCKNMDYLNVGSGVIATVFPWDDEVMITGLQSESAPGVVFLFVTRSPFNLVPKMDAIGNQYATLSSPLQLTLHATDSQGDFLKFSSPTQFVTVDEKTGELKFLPTSAGVYTIAVVVRDAVGSFDSQEFKVTVDE